MAIYISCKEFHCLPDSGGWYDQNPDIIEAFGIISNEIAIVERMKQKREEMKMKRSGKVRG